MQGYGDGERRPRATVLRRLLAAVLIGAVLPATAGCSLLAEESSAPKPIVIPETDELITESATPSLSVSTSVTRPSQSFAVAPADSYRRAIDTAPRVGVGDYHRGATSPAGERSDDLSGVHFSTPDRNVRCSTGNNGADALVCAADRVRGRATPPVGSPDGCTWETDLVVLNADGVSAGACANLFPVLYRSQLLEYGNTLSAGGFSCLSDVDGIYCLESSSDKGFAITRSGYEEISGDDRAPAALRGSAPSSQPSSAPVPTR